MLLETMTIQHISPIIVTKAVVAETDATTAIDPCRGHITPMVGDAVFGKFLVKFCKYQNKNPTGYTL